MTSSGKSIEKLHEDFIYKSRYSRWDYENERRENWEQTVDRYFNFFEDRVPKDLIETFHKAKKYVVDLHVMPSMRALWTAGEALERENIAAYNCSALAINYIKAFADIMYLSLNGTGVGLSVERQFINQLPMIKGPLVEVDETIVVEDSKLGWAQAVLELTESLYEGKIPKIDVSKIRPAGSILKTFGGRASGPKPLLKAMKFMIKVFKKAADEGKLSSLDCHDISCSIAEAVVVGGTRRSALISLSNLSDLRMRHAKDGNFWDSDPQRAMANNSVAYTEKPSMKFFLDEWTNLMNSGTGERGVFNREAARKKIESIGRREPEHQWLINPCVAGNTLIKLKDDDICMKDVVDKFENGEDIDVLTYNIETKEIEVEKVVDAALTRKNTDVIKIEFDDGKFLELTPDHKVYTENRGYIKASQLIEEDELVFIE